MQHCCCRHEHVSLAAHLWSRQDIGFGKVKQIIVDGLYDNTVATMNMFEALLARQKQEAEDKIYFSSATSLSGIISKNSSSQYHFKAQDYLKVMDSQALVLCRYLNIQTEPCHYIKVLTKII